MKTGLKCLNSGFDAFELISKNDSGNGMKPINDMKGGSIPIQQGDSRLSRISTIAALATVAGIAICIALMLMFTR